MEYLIGAGIMWVVLAILFTWYQDSYNKAVEYFIALPLAIPVGIFIIVVYPLVKLWRFIRKKPSQGIKVVNTPSCPEGEFRIGKDE